MYQLLNDIKLVEASSFVASPSAGLYLAQLGADVVRVDQIGGGPDFKRWPVTDEGNSLYWENLNRAKKSVALDLRSQAGQALLQKLAAETGILLTNFPVTGFLAHDVLRALRPDMITIRIMGQADGGTALDYTVNNAVGIPMMTGPASLGDVPVNHVLPAWDFLTGAYAAFALLAALRRRDATGEGMEIRIPLQDVATGSVANTGMIAEVLYTGENRDRLGNAVFGTIGRDFVTRDGVRIMIVAITERQWIGLVKTLGLAADIAAIEAENGVSFRNDDGARFTHREAIFAAMDREIRARDHAEITALLDAEHIVHSPYRTMAEAVQDPRLVAANPMFATTSDNPSGLTYPAAGSFATIPNHERQSPQPAPAIGADSHSILAERLGLDADKIAALVAAGTVAQP